MVWPKPRALGIERDAEREIVAADGLDDLGMDVAVEFRKEVGPRVAVARGPHAVVGEVPVGVGAVHDLESIVVEHDAVPAESGVDRLRVVGAGKDGAGCLYGGRREGEAEGRRHQASVDG